MTSASISTPYTEEWLSGYDGHRFYTRTWAANSPTAIVFFIHGFGDHISRYDDVHHRWVEHSFTLFSYDLRGFGRTALDVENRSPGASYGRTSRAQEIADVEWWLKHLSVIYPGLPLFLLGYSAGGGLSLAFAARNEKHSSAEAVRLSGVIASAPLIHLTHPMGQLTRLISTYLSKLIPNKVVPATAPEEFLTRRPDVIEAIKKDSLRGSGEWLLQTGYQNWPENLPLLITHGTADEVNSPIAFEMFYNKLNAHDKQLQLYPDARHELLHEADDIPDQVINLYCSWIKERITSK